MQQRGLIFPWAWKGDGNGVHNKYNLIVVVIWFFHMTGMKLRHTICHLIMDRTSEILLATTSVDYDVVLFSKQRLQETGINDILNYSSHYFILRAKRASWQLYDKLLMFYLDAEIVFWNNRYKIILTKSLEWTTWNNRALHLMAHRN